LSALQAVETPQTIIASPLLQQSVPALPFHTHSSIGRAGESTGTGKLKLKLEAVQMKMPIQLTVAAPITVKIRVLDMLDVNRHPTNYWSLLAREKEFICTFKFMFWIL